MMVGEEEAHGTLLAKDDWREAAGARAHKLFATNQGIQTVAGLMARSHEYAIQYLEQAPALIPFITAGGWPRHRNERLLIAHRFGEAVNRGPRLKDLLARWQAPLPIRKISGSAVCRDNFTTIFALRHMEPSDLSQAIPEKPRHQAEWLRTMREWRRHEEWHPSRLGKPEIRRWAALAFSRDITAGHHPRGHAGDLADFIARQGERFSAKWTIPAALAAAEEWHRTLARQQHEEQFLKSHGMGFDQPIDYAPLPDNGSLRGFDFTALRTGRDLWIEGKAMRHCVSSYVREVMTGRSRIYSVTREGRRLATMELQPNGKRWRIAQLKGPCNAEPRTDTRQASALFVEQIQRALAVADEAAA